MLLTVQGYIMWSSTKTVFPQLVFPYSSPMFKAPSVATHNYMNWVPEREAGAVWEKRHPLGEIKVIYVWRPED